MKATSWLVALLALGTVTGCAGQRPPVFLHTTHRENYALQLEELRRVQFFVSEEVLAHELGEAGTLAGPDHVLLLERGTRGVATDAGPGWLRVSFDRGPGVLFLARAGAKPDSDYALATEGEPGEPVRRLQDLQARILRLGGRRFRIVHGASARLLVDADDLVELIDIRTRARGRKPD